jgi:hypothetical protein
LTFCRTLSRLPPQLQNLEKSFDAKLLLWLRYSDIASTNSLFERQQISPFNIFFRKSPSCRKLLRSIYISINPLAVRKGKMVNQWQLYRCEGRKEIHKIHLWSTSVPCATSKDEKSLTTLLSKVSITYKLSPKSEIRPQEAKEFICSIQNNIYICHCYIFNCISISISMIYYIVRSTNLVLKRTDKTIACTQEQKRLIKVRPIVPTSLTTEWLL